MTEVSPIFILGTTYLLAGVALVLLRFLSQRSLHSIAAVEATLYDKSYEHRIAL